MMIGIVDDTAKDREILKEMLNRYFEGAGSRPEMEEFQSGEEFLAAYVPERYQIIFFDIYMGGLTGMETAREVYRQDKNCRLIFFTSTADYAVDSYQVRAAYYLMKPLKYEELCQVLDTLGIREEKKDETISVHLKGGVVGEVLLGDILYVDCLRRMVRIHREDRILNVLDRLADIAACLEPYPSFLCCNRGIYVNMDWVRELGDDSLILKNGEELPIRIRGRGEVKRRYMRYALSDFREKT